MFFVIITGLLILPVQSHASLLYSASLRDGDYGGGSIIDTMSGTYPVNSGHGYSPHSIGITNSSNGVTFTATEADGRSNALLNWTIPNATARTQFRSTGTLSFLFSANRDTHVGGSILGDNLGFGSFYNGQGTFGGFASRVVNGTGTADDQVVLSWSTWHNNYWDPHISATIDYDQVYDIGYAWGGTANTFEIWVNGTLIGSDLLPAGYSLPYGQYNSGINFGLGDNHERGYDVYGSASGVTFADISIWNEYRPLGDTTAPNVVPEPATIALLGMGLFGTGLIRRRKKL